MLPVNGEKPPQQSIAPPSSGQNKSIPARGWLIAFLLHQSIWSLGSTITSLVEVKYGFPHVYAIDPSLIVWGALLGYGWWRLKPRLSDWVRPFLLFVGIWLFALGGKPDTAEEQEMLAFATAMFLACGTVLGYAMLLGGVRVVLGEGPAQQETLKRAVGYVLPQFRSEEKSASPHETLLRASDASQASPETMLRATNQQTDSAPEQLLRASAPEEPKQ